MIPIVPKIENTDELLNSLSKTLESISRDSRNEMKKMLNRDNTLHRIVTDYVASSLIPMYKRQGALISCLKHLSKCVVALKSDEYTVEAKQRELCNIIHWIDINGFRRLLVLVENLLQDTQQTLTNICNDLTSFTERHFEKYRDFTTAVFKSLGVAGTPITSWNDLDWIFQFNLNALKTPNTVTPEPNINRLNNLLNGICQNKDFISSFMPNLKQPVPILYNNHYLVYLASENLGSNMICSSVKPPPKPPSNTQQQQQTSINPISIISVLH